MLCVIDSSVMYVLHIAYTDSVVLWYSFPFYNIRRQQDYTMVRHNFHLRLSIHFIVVSEFND